MFGRFETRWELISPATQNAFIEWCEELDIDCTDEAELEIWLGNERYDNGIR